MVKEKWASTPYYARWLAAFFICSCLGFFIGMGLWAVSANADETDNSVYLDRMDALIMPLAVDESVVDIAKNHKHEDADWQAWEKTDSLPTGPGKYYLTKDVTIDLSNNNSSTYYQGPCKPKDGTVLCLNGKTVEFKMDWINDSGFLVQDGVTFTLCDCSNDNKGQVTMSYGNSVGGSAGYEHAYQYGCDKVKVENGGTFYMYNCTLSGFGSGVRIEADSKTKSADVVIEKCRIEDNGYCGVVIEGTSARSNTTVNIIDTIINNNGVNKYTGNITAGYSGKSGGGINITGGILKISGTQITNNLAEISGGGIYVGSSYVQSVKITNSDIIGNTSGDKGGGVCAFMSIELENVKITNNKASNGGGIYLTSKNLTLDNVEITNNEATNKGGGVYSEWDRSQILITLKNKVIINDNIITGTTTKNNLYLLDEIADGSRRRKISQDSSLASGSQIGCTVDFTNAIYEKYPAVFSETLNDDYSKYFTSDDETLSVENAAGNVLQLVQKITGIKLTDSSGNELTKLELTINKTQTLKVTLEPEGVEGEITWKSEDPSVAKVDSNGKVTAVGVGETNIVVSVGGQEVKLPVTVTENVNPNARPEIITQPRLALAEGESPIDKQLTVEATTESGNELKYTWYGNKNPFHPDYNMNEYLPSLKEGTIIGTGETLTIPDLSKYPEFKDLTVVYVNCLVTDTVNEKETYSKCITISLSKSSDQPSTGQNPTITTQPVAPVVPEGQSPVGQEIKVVASSPSDKELTYQWYYNTDNKTEGSVTVLEKDGGKTAACKIPNLDPGTYYFYCEITDSSGNKTITNIIKIVIPEKTGVSLEPGKNVTAENGTDVERTEDGQTVTIDKNGDKTTDVTIILPDENPKGEVTVDKTTGEVTVPGGSTVKDGDGTGSGSGDGKPDIVIGDKGGTVTPEGEVKIPEDGKATVGGTTDGNGNTTGGTTITGGSDDGNGNGTGSGSTITPNENGTVDVTGGTTVTIGGDGSGDGDDKKGTDITLPNGGNVNPNNGTITPDTDKDGNQIAGVDTDGDGKVDTLIVLPGTDGGDSDGDKLKPDGNGGVTLPAGTEIKGNGGSGDGSGDGTGNGEASITLPEGGTVTPGGGIKPEGEVRTGEDNDKDGNPDIAVTVPGDGEIKGDGEGGLTVPGGTTIKNGEDGSEITVGDKDDPDSIGGTLDGNGNITIPEGGSATVDTDGDGEPDTTITAPKGDGSGSGNGGSTITPNDDGTIGVSGGTTVKTGEDGTEVTVNDNDGKGGTVTTDGNIVLPPGGSVTVGGNGTGDGDDDGNKGGSTTTITVPGGSGDGSGSGENTTITPGNNGDVEVPNGSKVQTDNGSGSGNTPGGTPGGDDDNQNNSTEITLPNGGNVNAGDGTITPGQDKDGNQIAGVDTDNDGKVDTLIVLPGTDGNGTITPNENGGVNVPGGTEIKNGGEDGTGKDSESTITIGDQGGSVNNEGGVDLPKGGSATVDNGTDENGDKRPTTEITAGENGGTVKPNPDGGTDVSGQGTKVQVGGDDSGKPAITVDDKGGTVTPEGNIEIKDGASVTVGGENGQPGTTITAPTGKDDGSGGTTGGSTTVTPKDDGSVDVGQGGTVTTGGKDGENGTPVTLPAGGNVQPEDGTIKPTDNIIATGEDKDGDGIPDTVIILPDDKNTITPGDDGSITLPGGSTIQGSDGVNVTLPEGGQITSDGGVKPSGDGDLTIKGEDGQPDVSIKLPEGGAISGGENGGLQVPEGTEIKKDGENTPTVVVGENGGSLDKNGNITLPEGGSATITGSDGKNSIEITTPKGGTVDTTTGSTTAPQVEINGTTITAPSGDKVTTDKDGVTQVGPGTVITAKDGTITITEGNATLSKEGILTFPNGGKVKITKEDGTTQDRTVTKGGTIDINKLGGSGSGPSSSGHGGSSGGGVSSNAPVISKTEHGTVSITPTRPQTGDKVTLTAKPEKGYQVDSVTVTDKDGKNVTVTKNSDGTYSFTQPEGKVTISVKFRETSTTQPAMTMNYKDCGKGSDCLIGQFTDCLADAWYHDGIHYCLANGLMNGTSTTTFGPNESTTRGQIVTILYRVEGEPAAGSSPFSDVASGQYYAKAVAWGAANGIVKGYSETQFAPEDKVTREQLAAILFRYAQFKGLDVSARGDLSSFSDSGAVSGYAVEAMEWAVGSGLMNGDNGALRPAGNATRAEMAVMLMRFLDK